MNKYPGYVPPGSGKFTYNEYAFARLTNHIGVYDYMTADSFGPSSYYNPINITKINDINSTFREAVNSASIEMGMGNAIADIAKFANANNLGYQNQRVGVSYFINLGISGNTSWWTDNNILKSVVVQSGSLINTINTDTLVITSGFFSNNNQIKLSNSTVITTYGTDYIDSLYDANTNKTWLFNYANIYTTNNISLLSGNFQIYAGTGNGVLSGLYAPLFKNTVQTKGLTLNPSAIVSGFHDTFQILGISDTNLINYSSSGHAHTSSGWLSIEKDYPVVSNVFFDGRYYTTVSPYQILTMDSLGTNNNWTPGATIGTGDYPNNNATRLYVNNGVLYAFNNIFTLNTIQLVPQDKNAILNNQFIFTEIGDNKFSIITVNITNNDTTSFPIITEGVQENSEFYSIDGNVYFVNFDRNNILNLYKYNGTVWLKFSQEILGTYINSFVSKNEIFFAFTNGGKLNLWNFTTTFTAVGPYPLFGDKSLRRVDIIGHNIAQLNNTELYVCNINDKSSNKYDPTKNQKLFDNLTPDSTLSVYKNANYYFIQVDDSKRRLIKNVSGALTLDIIGGIANISGNITILDSLNTLSPIFAATSQSLYTKTYPMNTDPFVLDINRTDFTESYLDRYVYKSTFGRASTYNDLTTSTLYNGQYYFAHRGDISVFSKNSDGSFADPKPSSLRSVIPVKFISTGSDLYALVQDFTSTTIDVESISISTKGTKPQSPFASYYVAAGEGSLYGGNDFIPYVPEKWSIPFTKIIRKNRDNENWQKVDWIDNKFGRNIIDAISYDNNLYIIAHDSTGSGIISSKFDASNSFSETKLTFSGCLENYESFMSLPGNIIWQFVPDVNGNYISITGVYSGIVSPDINGYHEIYTYNHPNGPYVIHDQVEVLYDSIAPSSIWPLRGSLDTPVNGYVMTNFNNQYLYRTISLSFLQEPETKSNRINTPFSQYSPVDDRNVNNPNIKIPLLRDSLQKLTPDILSNKYTMKMLADNSLSRNTCHFITSITHGTRIYIIMQINSSISIYSINTNEDYYFKTPSNTAPLIGGTICYVPPGLTGIMNGATQGFQTYNPTYDDLYFYDPSFGIGAPIATITSGHLTKINDSNISGDFSALSTAPGTLYCTYQSAVNYRKDVRFNTKTVFGDVVSYAGIKTPLDMPAANPNGNSFYLDFLPYDSTTHLCTQIDLTKVLTNISNIYVLGDGDDLFIQKPKSRNYRYNKRYSTPSPISIGGSLYLPLTCRNNYPIGELYTIVLGFFADGTIGLVDKDNVPTQIITRPMGRTQSIYNNGSYVIGSIKLNDSEPVIIDYQTISQDPTYGNLIIDNVTQSFSNMYNTFGNKDWIIGEYDITVEDNLNVREIL